ncbi:MAG TPA: HigA family addiction module antitoxin [Tangfeifania sp.]|nr:HigA family addiction module antitoxin [Tangfeifania sp.]
MNNKFANDMVPGDAFHPAEIIKEEMEAQNVKQTDLVQASGYNKSFISLFLKGKRSITLNLALALEKVLDIPAEFWVRLQKQYEMNKSLIELREMKNAS